MATTSEPETLPRAAAFAADAAAPSPAHVGSDDRALQAHFDRLRTLESVWEALTATGICAGSLGLGQACTDLREKLDAIANSGSQGGSLARADRGLDEFELAMRDVACNVSIPILRAKLPEAAKRNRAVVLELLDVMLFSDASYSDGELGSRLSAVDYLITLLCTDTGADATAIRHDPVTLTPRLQSLCQSAETTDGPIGARAEADFYSAAQVENSDARALEKQKTDLGREFFAPRILRAITTYNASRIAPKQETAPASEPTEPTESEVHDPSASVFETTALMPLIDALRRRVNGAQQGSSAVDRVAWCLDLDFATPSETAMLLESSGASRDNPVGAAILVGLLCKAIDILNDELLSIGISPDVLSTEWANDLSDAIKVDVNQRILHDGYNEACALSDLRSKFLDFSGRTAPEGWRPAAPSPPPRDENREMRKTATQLATQALDAPVTSYTDRSEARAGDEVRSRLLKIGAALTTVLALVAAIHFQTSSMPEGRVPLSNGELAQISPYLESAQRNGDGSDTSFVGTLDENWSQLDTAQREASAIDLVATLRLLGARKIMIYDGAHRVRVQAVGEGSVRIPATESPSN